MGQTCGCGEKDEANGEISTDPVSITLSQPCSADQKIYTLQ